MGKYSHLKNDLTKFSTEPEYQEKVTAERDRVKSLLIEVGEAPNAVNFGHFLVKAKIEKKRLEDLEKAENLTIEAMIQELVELLEGEGYSALKLGNGISMSIKDDVYCAVKDKESFYKWIKENDLEDLFSVNYQTMSSMVKNKLIDGEEIPPGIETYFKQGIIVRGIKNLEQD
jgi:hypothetical protein